MRRMYSLEEILRLVTGGGMNVVDALPDPSLGAKDKIYRINSTNETYILSADGTEFVPLSAATDKAIKWVESLPTSDMFGTFYVVGDEPGLHWYNGDYGWQRITDPIQRAWSLDEMTQPNTFYYHVDEEEVYHTIYGTPEKVCKGAIKHVLDLPTDPDENMLYEQNGKLQHYLNGEWHELGAAEGKPAIEEYTGQTTLEEDHFYKFNGQVFYVNNGGNDTVRVGQPLISYYDDDFPEEGDPDFIYDQIYDVIVRGTGEHFLRSVNNWGIVTDFHIGGAPITVVDDMPTALELTKIYRVANIDGVFVAADGKDEPIDITTDFEFVEDLPAIGGADHHTGRLYIKKGEYDKLWYAYAGAWKSIGAGSSAPFKMVYSLPPLADAEDVIYIKYSEPEKMYYKYKNGSTEMYVAIGGGGSAITDVASGSEITDVTKIYRLPNNAGLIYYDKGKQQFVNTKNEAQPIQDVNGVSEMTDPFKFYRIVNQEGIYYFDEDSNSWQCLKPSAAGKGFEIVLNLPDLADAEDGVFYIKEEEPNKAYYKKNMYGTDMWMYIGGGSSGGKPVMDVNGVEFMDDHDQLYRIANDAGLYYYDEDTSGWECLKPGGGSGGVAYVHKIYFPTNSGTLNIFCTIISNLSTKQTLTPITVANMIKNAIVVYWNDRYFSNGMALSYTVEDRDNTINICYTPTTGSDKGKILFESRNYTTPQYYQFYKL